MYFLLQFTVIFKNSFLLNHEDPRDVPHTTGRNMMYTIHPWVFDQGIKFCSKIQSARNRFKPDESVGLVVANPTQLVSSQTDVGSERYCNLFVKSNRQKNGLLSLYSPYRLTWQGRTDRTMMWHLMTWQNPVGC
jgi:hypothetical protein